MVRQWFTFVLVKHAYATVARPAFDEDETDEYIISEVLNLEPRAIVIPRSEEKLAPTLHA